jgi:predicted esterase
MATYLGTEFQNLLRRSRMLAVGWAACAATSAPALAQAPVDVEFLSATPVIDGRLDAGLDLPPQTFSHRFTFGNPEVEPVAVVYRLGYTATHLYLHIQTSAELVTEHRRGWLWGDGYKLNLTQPSSSGRSEHYYELGFSPNSLPAYRRLNQLIIGQNFEPLWRDFSEHTRSAASESPEGTGFEALIAWSDVAPYHPWLSEQLGVNLYFAKAFFGVDGDQFPNGYAIVEDEAIWDESLSDRAWAPLAFASPEPSTEPQIAFRPSTGRIVQGQRLSLEVAYAGPEDTLAFTVREQGEDRGGITVEQRVPASMGITSLTVEFDTSSLRPGRYLIERAGGSQARAVTILPDIDMEALSAPLLAALDSDRAGAAASLLFPLQTYGAALADRPSYQTAGDLFEAWSQLEPALTVFIEGGDPFLGRAGPCRRAFRSEIDGSLQPYSIKLPDDYDPSRAYPMIVFLHGSAQSDEGLLNLPRSNGAFIEIAPFGRDMYGAYASEESQIDIQEAIADASRWYNIDPDRIVIGGFSMGGYGALRTFYETPDLYAGVAVFAGHPNLANEWLGGGHPDFLDPSTQAVLIDTPVFIYHGQADEALDPDLMKRLADSLAGQGAAVTTRFVPGRGHQYQDEETHAAFEVWLGRIVGGTPG